MERDNEPGADLPVILTIEETARFLRIGRTSAYELARTSQLPAIRLGRTLRVPRSALLAWIEQEAAAQGPQEQPAGVWGAQV